MEVEKDRDEDGEVMLPGFRFHPTDEELIGFYLKRKVEKKPIGMELIKQIDIYKYDPWDLPKVSNCAGDKEWYFFCRRGRKYRNSIRPNRVTGSGFWKATGIDKPVYSVKEPLECIGLKKSLVYYRGSAGKGSKTDWMMNEFRLPPANNHGKNPNYELNAKLNITQGEAEVWTLCRIFKRIPSNKKYTPADWVEASLTKQNIVDSSSNTGSLESDHCSEPAAYSMSLEESVIQPVHTNDWFVGQLMSPTAGQAPFEASYSSFRDPNDNDIFADGSWDELRPVVQLAVDYPSQF